MSWAFWKARALTREQELAARLRRVAVKLRDRYSDSDDPFVYPHGFKAVCARATRAEELARMLDAGEITYDQAIEEATAT